MTSISPNVSPAIFYSSSCHVQPLSQNCPVGMKAASIAQVGAKCTVSYRVFIEGSMGYSHKMIMFYANKMMSFLIWIPFISFAYYNYRLCWLKPIFKPIFKTKSGVQIC